MAKQIKKTQFKEDPAKQEESETMVKTGREHK